MRRSLAMLPALALVGALAGCQGGDDAGSSAGSSAAQGDAYVALGDSYTAAPLVPTTDTSDACLRSDGNYPHLAAEEAGLALTDVSCSGATTADLTGSQATTSGTQAPQLEALAADTAVVTVGIGGNDLSTFATLVTSCVQLASSDPGGSPCTDAARAQGRSLAETGRRIRDNVAAVVDDAAERSPGARLLLVGYPDVVPRSGSCEQLPIAAGDYPFARDVLAMLNDAVEGAARSTGADYLDVAAATRGHDVCADDPWVAGAQPVDGEAAPYHPYAAEQQAVADLVVDALGT